MEVFLLSLRGEHMSEYVLGTFSTSYKARGYAERLDKSVIGNWVGDYPFGWQARSGGLQYVVDIYQLDKAERNA